MKKLLFVTLIMFMFSCEQPVDNGGSATIIEKDNTEDLPTPTPIPTTPPSDDQQENEPIITPTLPEQNDSSILFGLYDGTELKFYDGENFISSYEGKITYAGNRAMSIDDVLYFMDSEAEATSSYQLPESPDALILPNNTNSRSLAYQDEIWTLINMTGSESAALGAIGVPHLKIMKNDTEIGHWWNNDYEVDFAVMTSNNEVLVKSTAGHLYNISGDTVPTQLYGSLYISDIDYTNRRALFHTPEGSEWVNYSTNNFIMGLWQRVGDSYYTNRGAKYTYGQGVTEEATSLFDFVGLKYQYNELYNLNPAGQREENSEMVSYWICSTSGDLYKHIPSVDRYERIKNIYQGAKNYATGNMEYKTVKPEWIDDKLYFHFDNSLNCYDPVDGSVSIVSDSGEVFLW